MSGDLPRLAALCCVMLIGGCSPLDKDGNELAGASAIGDAVVGVNRTASRQQLEEFTKLYLADDLFARRQLATYDAWARSSIAASEVAALEKRYPGLSDYILAQIGGVVRANMADGLSAARKDWMAMFANKISASEMNDVLAFFHSGAGRRYHQRAATLAKGETEVDALMAAIAAMSPADQTVYRQFAMTPGYAKYNAILASYATADNINRKRFDATMDIRLAKTFVEAKNGFIAAGNGGSGNVQ